MGSRLELQTLLEGITQYVYFQPPATVSMQYPCIVYHRDYAYVDFADNSPYKRCKRYVVTIIDRNPDSTIPDQIAELPMCTFQRYFAKDNLNHDVYNLYF